MKKISLLGSTGSIGVNTLDVIDRNPEKFQVLAMSAGSNIDLFAEQVRKFKPKIASLFDSTKISTLKERVADLDVEIIIGHEGSIAVATLPETDVVVSGVVGSAGLIPAIEALKAGKTLHWQTKKLWLLPGNLF